jgi:hypothetical protein
LVMAMEACALSVSEWSVSVGCEWVRKRDRAIPMPQSSPKLLVLLPRAAKSSMSRRVPLWRGSSRRAPAPLGDRFLVELPLLAPSV